MEIGDALNRFTGIFNGDFNNITNLWINSPYTNIGFFSSVENATIRNLNIKAAEDKGIRGVGYIGGITGYAERSNITNSCFAGNINGNIGIGGIVGRIEYSSITNSCSAGNVNGSNQVGGIAGSVIESSITNSYSTVNVNGKSFISGIAGYISVSNITNSYSIGSISGNQYIGGIVGFTQDAVTIQNNVAINPSITGEMYVNRVFGSFRDNIIISNNFALDTMVGGVKYDGVTNSFLNSSDAKNHGIDKTQIELKTRSTYENDEASGGLGWKFGSNNDNPWKIDPNKNNGYPYLYWQDMR
jgi:hypothetical protein